MKLRDQPGRLGTNLKSLPRRSTGSENAKSTTHKFLLLNSSGLSEFHSDASLHSLAPMFFFNKNPVCECRQIPLRHVTRFQGKGFADFSFL